MLDLFLSFLPASVCLFWIVTLWVMASRTNAFREAILFLILTGCYLMLDQDCPIHGIYPPKPISYVFLQLFATSVIPSAVMAVYRFRTGKKIPPITNIWAFVPIILFVVASLLTSIAGNGVIQAYLDEVRQRGLLQAVPFRETLLYRFHIITGILAQSILSLECLGFAVYIIINLLKGHCSVKTVAGFFRGGRITVMELQLWNLTGFLVLFIIRMIVCSGLFHVPPVVNLILGLLMSYFLFSFGFVSLFSSRSVVTSKDFHHSFRFDYSLDGKAAAEEQMLSDMLEEADDETLRRVREKIGKSLPDDEFKKAPGPGTVAPGVASRIFTAVSGAWDEDSLTARFEQLVLGGKLYLRPSLTLVDVAERLHTNKTYVSKMVNNVYHMPFPDLINTLRIDYAEQYIVAHRNAKQQEIATACGFQSASSFNNTFKKITGVTPKIWLATYDNASGQ